MMKWKEIVALTSIVIVATSAGTTLYFSDFKRILAAYPDARFVVVDNPLYYHHILTGEPDDFARWRISKQKWNTFYTNRSIAGDWTFEIEYFRTYGEDRWVSLIPKRTLVTTDYIIEDESVTVRKITPYYASGRSGSGGNLIEEYILPYDAESSMKINVIFEPNKKSPDRTDDLHRITMRFKDVKGEMEAWNNHLIFGNVQFSFEDAADKIEYITADRVGFEPTSGERIEIDPVIRIGPVAITYDLITDDFYGRSYTPDCLTLCHLPMNISLNKDVQIKDWNDLTWRVVKKNQKSKGVKSLSLRVLENITYKKTFINVTEVFSNYTTSNGTVIQNRTVIEERYPVERWRWAWVDAKPPTTFKKDTIYSLDFEIAREFEYIENSIDFKPIIKGIEIPFAWLGSMTAWDYYTNITVVEPNVIGRNASTGVPSEPIDAHFTPTTAPANCTKEFRVINKTGDEIDSQVWNESYAASTCTDANVVFTLNMSITESHALMVFYGNGAASMPSYSNRTNFNDPSGAGTVGIFSIDGHKRFEMSAGSIRTNYGDTDTWESGLQIYVHEQFAWGDMWDDSDPQGLYRIGNDSYRDIHGPLKTTINVTNGTGFGTPTLNYLIDVYPGRKVAYYRFDDSCRNWATDTGCGDWVGAAEAQHDKLRDTSIDSQGGIYVRNADGTLTEQTAVGAKWTDYGFVSSNIGTTDLRIFGWQDEGGSTQTDMFGYGASKAHNPYYDTFSNTWTGTLTDADGNLTNTTIFYQEINQNVGPQINDSYMAYTNPATYSWGTEETAPPPPNNGPQFSQNITKYPNGTIYNTTKTYGFEIKWTTETGEFNTSNVTFEANFTGALTNYTYIHLTNYIRNDTPDIFYINFSQEEFANASLTQFRWYAENGTKVGGWTNNRTDYFNFTITKGTIRSNLTLNGTIGNKTYETIQVANFTVFLNVSGLDANLSSNYTGFASQTSTTPLMNYTTLMTSGDWWNMTGYFDGNENYTSSFETHYFNVTKIVTSTTLELNSSSVDRYYEWGSVVNFSCTMDAGGACLLTSNNSVLGTDFNASSFVWGSATSGIMQLTTGNHSQNVSFNGTNNNKTISVKLHAYDRIINATFNFTGYQSDNENVSNVKIYINNTLSNILLGNLEEGEKTLTTLNDSSSTKNITFDIGGTITDYLYLPANANVTGAKLNLTGYEWDAQTLKQGESDNNFINPNYQNWNAQSFNLSSEKSISNISLRVRKFNNEVNGNVTAELRLGTDSAPNSSILTNFSLTLNEVTTSFKWYNFTWDVVLNATTRYWIVVKSNATISKYYTRYHTGNKYENGTARTTGNAGSSWSNPDIFGDNYDVAFILYGKENITNPYLDVGGEGVIDWNYTGQFNLSVSPIRTGNFTDNITTFLDTCSQDTFGYCGIPLVMHSGTGGILNISAIEINYTVLFNPIELDIDLINSYLQNSTGYVNLPINISSETNGTINVTAINFTYYGSNVFNVTAYFTGNGTHAESRDEQNFHVVYSNFTAALPYTWTEDILWYPKTNGSYNVSPWAQTNTIPIFNVTWNNYYNNTNLAIRVNYTANRTAECLKYSVSNDSGVMHDEFNISNTTYTQIYYNRDIASANTTNIWIKAHLNNCNRTEMAYMVRRFELLVCCEACMSCW